MLAASNRTPVTPPSGSSATTTHSTAYAARLPPAEVASARMSGYSGTPLPRKLGIKPGHRVLVLGAPQEFVGTTLGELPDGVALRRSARGSADVIVSFHDRRAALARRMPALRALMEPAAGLWIAWPK